MIHGHNQKHKSEGVSAKAPLLFPKKSCQENAVVQVIGSRTAWGVTYQM